MKLKIHLLLFSLGLLLSAQAQYSFQVLYGQEAGNVGCNGISRTTDGGTILVGTISVSGNSTDIYLVKTDRYGNLLWNKTCGTFLQEAGISVAQCSDGGYIAAGYIHNSVTDDDFYIVRTDSSGNLQWSRKYGSFGQEIPCSVQQTTDGGYFFCGYAESFGPRSAYAIKTDPLGNINWTKTYRGQKFATGFSGMQTADGGYVIAGAITDSLSTWVYDAFLLKTNPSGDTLWTRTFGSTGVEAVYSVKQTADGGYILAGLTSSFGAGANDIFLTKTNATGFPQWTKTFGGAGPESVDEVDQVSDGGYIICGSTPSFTPNEDIYLIRTDSSGNAAWTKNFGLAGGDYGYGVEEAGDGGFFVAGELYNLQTGNPNAFLLKTTSPGSLVCNEQTPATMVTSPTMPVSGLHMIVFSGGLATVVTTSTSSLGTDSTLCSDVGIEEQGRPQTPDVFPNPFTGETRLHSRKYVENGTIRIYNAEGALVRTETGLAGTDFTISRRGLPAGIYWLVFSENEDAIATEKLVIVE